MRIIRIYYHGSAVSGAFGEMNGNYLCDERGVLSGEREGESLTGMRFGSIIYIS